jgi:hypothetical protein
MWNLLEELKSTKYELDKTKCELDKTKCELDKTKYKRDKAMLVCKFIDNKLGDTYRKLLDMFELYNGSKNLWGQEREIRLDTDDELSTVKHELDAVKLERDAVKLELDAVKLELDTTNAVMHKLKAETSVVIARQKKTIDDHVR